jgi:hypothetical protein
MRSEEPTMQVQFDRSPITKEGGVVPGEQVNMRGT